MSPLIFSHNSPRMVKNSRQFISGNILESTQKSTLILMSFFFFFYYCQLLAATLVSPLKSWTLMKQILVVCDLKKK